MKDLVTFLIITYNQELFIGAALEGAVNQDYDNLEIIVADDASTDSTYKIICEFINNYKGKHEIKSIQSNTNLGLVGNLNNALSLARGKYIVLAAGDDVSMPNRCSYSLDVIKRLGVSSVSFSYQKIDSKSNVIAPAKSFSDEESVLNFDDYFAGLHFNTGCARIIEKSIFSTFGNLQLTCPTEDTTLNFRALLLGGLGVCDSHMINYRIHGENISKGVNKFKRIRCEDIYAQYLKDLNIALSLKLISSTNYLKLKQYIDKYLEHESLIQKLYGYGSVGKRFLFLMHVFFSNAQSKTKKILLRKFFSWTINRV